MILDARDGEFQNISRGRNAGARASKGEILVFINADTIVGEPERFLSEVITAIRRPGIAGVTCSVRVYPEEERLVDRLFHGFYNRYFLLLNRLGVGMGRGECHVVSREIFFSVGGYRESMAAGEDFDLYLRLRRLGKIEFLSRLLVFESPRRYRKYGYSRITLLWFLNAVWVFLFKKSLHRDWEPVR